MLIAVSVLILILIFISALTFAETFLSAALWVFLRLPFGLLLIGLGVLCCLTVLLLPLGAILLILGLRVLT